MAQLNHPLKILQVIDRLDAGGAERVMVDLSNILSRKGHEVTTMSILDHGLLEGDLDPKISKLKYMRNFSRVAKNNDIVHVHMRHNLKYVWLVKLLFPFKANIVFHDHYGKINVDQSVPASLSRAMRKVLYIGVSKQLADWAIEKAGLGRDSVFHLSNIIIRKEVNRKTELQSEGINLVMVSNIRKEKNIELAIKIVNRLLKKNNAHLTIYGQLVDRNYFELLTGMIKDLMISENIRFVHDCTDIQPELHQYDLAIHTAKSETGPLVLIEYLCQELPFISFRTGEVIDQLKDALPHFIMDTFEEDDWVERIDQVQSMNFGDQLIKLYEQKYSEENYYQQCMKIYKKSLIC